MIRPSTFSIVAYDASDQAWGVAVASKFLAVGNVVPWAQAGAGAVATQSLANTSFGPQGLSLMTAGLSAQDTLDQLLARDPQCDLRQVGMVDSLGRAATFTGSGCYDWAGGVTGPGYAIQGNILVGAQVVENMQRAFLDSQGSLYWRLYAALLAGDQAGGDRRGRQSAAIYVAKAGAGYGGFTDRWADYRVDDHPNPVVHLRTLLDLHELYFGVSRPEIQVSLSGDTLLSLQKIMLSLGYLHTLPDGIYSAATRQALEAFSGNENFEERIDLVQGLIDRPVLDYFLARFDVGEAHG